MDWKLYQEAYRRGILPPDKIPLYEEAMARGLVDGQKKYQQGEKLSWSDVPGKAMDNFLPSAGRVIDDTIDAITSPIETGKAVGKTIIGAVPGLRDVVPEDWQAAEHTDALLDYFGDRYGSLDGFKGALAYDPAGVIADASTFFTGGAGALRGVAKGASVANKASAAAKLGRAADVAGRLGLATDPLAMGLKGVGWGADALAGPNGIAGRLYQSALKPPTTMPISDRNRLIKTGLAEKIVPTPKGFEKARGLVRDIGTDIDAKIAEAAAQGKTIDAVRLANDVYGDMDRLFSTQVAPSADRAAVFDTVLDFQEGHPGTLTIPKAHNLKKGTYRVLKDKAYRGELKSATTETQKALARGLKEQVEQAVPGVKELNARQGALLELIDPLERAVGRTGNWNMLSMPGLISGATVSTVNPAAGVALTGLTSAARSAPLKAHLAFALDSGDIPRKLHNLGVAGYGGGRLQQTYEDFFPFRRVK